MGIHVLVVGRQKRAAGQPPRKQSPVDIVASFVRTDKSRLFHVADPCETPESLVGTVRDLAVKSGALVDKLDLHDHGASGSLHLGKQTLFRHDGTGRLIARALRPLLSQDARVRLLGCNTASGPNGRKLLRMLQEELGGSVVVYGTIGGIDSPNFDKNGFKENLAQGLLFSSTEAATHEAPSFDQRLRDLISWHGSHSPSPRTHVRTHRTPSPKSR